ncbi:Exocyst complex component 4 [Toxocara canis]|uniref:Exocyst complex component Sec8 n=1 Tax=Toxocara canis TaxID=6265 RepID=A0A0B2W3B5_TOXCA|nr:Exocyst complex component 4 [Toxocara canis]
MTSREEKPRCPPRGRTTNESSTSALLLNMIRTLTTSSSEDQKELDRRRLEMGFVESSAEIDQLVQACRERVHSVRNGLLTCRTLLQCRRDDLKRLWMENAQQRYVSSILAQIESIKRIGSEVDEAISHTDYLKAANSLKEADLLLNGPFSNIDGLSHLRTQVHETSKKLVKYIVDDITNHLIVRPFELQLLEVIKSLPESKVSESAECVGIVARCSAIRECVAAGSEDDASAQLLCCIRALCVFGYLGTTLTRIANTSPAVLQRLIHLSAAVICVAFDGSEKGDARHLAHYMQLLLSQLRASYDAHCLMDEQVKKVQSEQDNPEQTISLAASYWTMAQETIEKVVSEYVYVHTSSPQNTSEKSSISSEKPVLFRFDASACAATATNNQSSKQTHSRVCSPSPWNITSLYQQLERFCDERETQSGQKPCTLRRFLHTFIVDVFIDRFKCKLENLAEQALHGNDAWRALVHYPNPKVLASCWNMFAVCEEIGKLIETMPAYTERLSALWLLVIDEFAKSATGVYEKIIRPSSEGEEGRERRKISAAWAVDEDISRLLKSLPNWFMVSTYEATPTPSLGTPSALPPITESESDIRQRNERESEILIGNLGTAKQLVREELITDMELIRSLVCMHESLKWFCSSMRALIIALPESARTAMHKCFIQMQSPNSELSHTEENIYAAVERRLSELDAMADTCLLIIHLELRVHCFFHLLPLARIRPSLPHDELDNEVVDFGRDMMQFHQLLNTYLPLHKMKYLFDGLGHLSASIFIHSSQHMQKLSENGKKRVCRNVFAVQQRLSQLTGRRESELERARAFFELLNHDPDQLLALILERGAVFSHLEYTYLLSLAVRSHAVLGAQPGALEQRISQLKSILSQIKKP